MLSSAKEATGERKITLGKIHVGLSGAISENTNEPQVIENDARKNSEVAKM